MLRIALVRGPLDGKEYVRDVDSAFLPEFLKQRSFLFDRDLWYRYHLVWHGHVIGAKYPHGVYMANYEYAGFHWTGKELIQRG